MYDGDWLGDKKHGVGVYKYSSGAVYEGEYQNDLKHGMCSIDKWKIAYRPRQRNSSMYFLTRSWNL